MMKQTAMLSVTTEFMEDRAHMQEAFGEWMRELELARRGFLGLVRCDWCNRKLRCVSLAIGGRFYGRDCAEKVA